MLPLKLWFELLCGNDVSIRFIITCRKMHPIVSFLSCNHWLTLGYFSVIGKRLIHGFTVCRATHIYLLVGSMSVLCSAKLNVSSNCLLERYGLCTGPILFKISSLYLPLLASQFPGKRFYWGCFCRKGCVVVDNFRHRRNLWWYYCRSAQWYGVGRVVRWCLSGSLSFIYVFSLLFV